MYFSCNSHYVNFKPHTLTISLADIWTKLSKTFMNFYKTPLIILKSTELSNTKELDEVVSFNNRVRKQSPERTNLAHQKMIWKRKLISNKVIWSFIVLHNL